MNKTYTDTLFQVGDYFKPENPESLMKYGFACGDGWFKLILELCMDINATDKPYNFEVVQVKDKFGELRFYYDNGNSAIDGLVREAMKKSELMCIGCGERREENVRIHRSTVYSDFNKYCRLCYLIEMEKFKNHPWEKRRKQKLDKNKKETD